MTSVQKRWSLLVLLALSVGLCLQVALIKRPPNYWVVTGAAENIIEGRNPYAPQAGLDFFKYSPLAGLMTVPFSKMPEGVGLFLFVFLQAWLFFYGFYRWASSAGVPPDLSLPMALVAFVSVAFDATVAIQNAQVNAGLFGLMLLSAAHYAEGKRLRSGLGISLAADLKLFPFTLGLCLLAGFNRRYWAGFWGGLLLWFALPAVFLGWIRNLELLRQWFELMTWDVTRNLDMLDIGSFMGVHWGVAAWWRNPLALVVGAWIGAGSVLLFRRGEIRLLNRFLLPINGLYILLFSYLSESPTSILATAAIYLIGWEAVRAQPRRRAYWGIWAAALLLVPLFYTDLVPPAWNGWARAFHLKTVGYLWVSVVCAQLALVYRRRLRTAGLSPQAPAEPST